MHQLLYDYIYGKTGIDPKAFSEFCHYFKPKKVKNNEFIVREGDICNYNIFVNKGCLKIFSLNEKGKAFVRYFVFEGKFGTALSSFIEGSPSFEYVQAIEPSEILIISKKDFFYLVKTIPEINFIYRDVLEMAYVTSQKRIYDLQGKSAFERLKWLMEYQPKILARLSNKVVASYLGITPYTLSRLKTEF